jgi:flagellar biosynthetic protein FlhB
MAEDSDLERTEPASPRRLDQAREQGNVPHSRELSTLAVLMASVGVIAALGVFMFRGLHRVMHNSLSFDTGDIATPAMMGRNLMEAGTDGLLLFLPLALAVVVAAVAANVLVSGWVFSPKAMEFNLGKLNPISGIARLFSMTSLAELVKAILKGGLIAGVAGWMIWHQRDAILGLAVEPLDAAMAHFGQITLFTFVAAAAAFGLIVVLDVPFQLWHYHKSLRMTKEEVRQESKEMEGDPQIKARIRSLQREAARRRMMQAVPKADVVVTNPMHFAVALKYEERTMSAPLVVAKVQPAGGGTHQGTGAGEPGAHRRGAAPGPRAAPPRRGGRDHSRCPVHRRGPGAGLRLSVEQVHEPGPARAWDVPPNLDPAHRQGLVATTEV